MATFASQRANAQTPAIQLDALDTSKAMKAARIRFTNLADTNVVSEKALKSGGVPWGQRGR